MIFCIFNIHEKASERCIILYTYVFLKTIVTIFSREFTDQIQASTIIGTDKRNLKENMTIRRNLIHLFESEKKKKSIFKWGEEIDALQK